MMATTIRHLEDAEAVCRAGAEELIRVGREAIAARARFIVALSGGSTPRRLFELLTGAAFRNQLDWNAVDLFWGDERAVPPDHKDSNFGMTRHALLQPLGISPARTHRMQAEREDRDAAAREYQAEIARVFGISPNDAPPAFDLVLLGMGPDGHTASLFPHTEALKETSRWVVPNYVPKLSAHRLTMTPTLINRAAYVMFLVAGADKATSLAEVLEGPPDLDRLPSQRIRPASGALLWLIDQASASKLTRKVQ